MLMLQKIFIFLQNSTSIVTSFHLKAKLKKAYTVFCFKRRPEKKNVSTSCSDRLFFGTPLHMSLFNDLAFYNPDSNIIIGPISPPNLFGQGVFQLQFWKNHTLVLARFTTTQKCYYKRYQGVNFFIFLIIFTNNSLQLSYIHKK